MKGTTSQHKKTNNPVIGIRVEPSVKRRLRAVADREMTPGATLARMWILKGLKALEADIRKEIAEEVA